jgi:hypothetical protein
MVSKTLITPGCLSVLNLRTAFFASGRRDLFALISKENTLQEEPSSYSTRRSDSLAIELSRMSQASRRTRFVPLCSAQTESPMSTLSPREKGCPVPLAMADATADLRKSIAMGYVLAVRGSGIVWGRRGCARGAANCQVSL